MKKRLIVIKPVCELAGRSGRMDSVLLPALEYIKKEGVEVVVAEKTAQLDDIPLGGERVLFAVCLNDAGINMEYYRLLEGFRKHPACLNGTVGGIIVDGSSELYTKALARRLAFSANRAGCTLPGKPLVEATGSMGNFHVLATIRGTELIDIYRQQVMELVRKILDFELPVREKCCDYRNGHEKLKVLAIHASQRKTSNTMLLWDKVRSVLNGKADITEISLRDGAVTDCRGCRYEECLHFGEIGRCFYGGIITEQVYPAILDCDVLIMICPNYNDAVSANLTAFINRLTAMFRVHDFSKKRLYAIVVSGYSGGDIVAEQILGALNFNKSFILPGRFSITETANDPFSILGVQGIDETARVFAENIW